MTILIYLYFLKKSYISLIFIWWKLCILRVSKVCNFWFTYKQNMFKFWKPGGEIFWSVAVKHDLFFLFALNSSMRLTYNSFFGKIYRYGSLFKSHILGCPTVVCMDPELNRFILMNEGKGFVPGYPQSMLDILGKCNIAAIHGSLHKAMRSVMLGLINPPVIKDQLLPKIDEFMGSHLSSWNGRIIDIQEKTKEVCRIPPVQ